VKDIELLVLRHELEICGGRSLDRSSGLLIGRYRRPRPAICRAPRGMFCW
jgi:hypothetical protein